MNKLIACILILSIVLMTSFAYAESTEHEEVLPDFKTFYWGDSKETVIAVEGKPELEDKMPAMDAEFIAYETEAVGLDVVLAYYFCDEGLYQVRYVLTEEHSNESLYIDDYKTFRDALTKKYGEPLLDTENWANDSKKEYYSDKKGDALCYGYLTFETWYLTDRSYILMNMSADNYEISMTVDYRSKEVDPGEADYSNDI